MQGSLQDMDVATLIQHTCQDRKVAQLDIQQNGQQATLFFKEGEIVHATYGDIQGEEVVYEIINWTEGTFSLQTGVESPETTIDSSWSGLLLAAAQRFDEQGEDELDDFDDSEPEDEVEVEPPEQAASPLSQALNEFLEDASEIEGGAIVGVDGVIIAAYVPHTQLDTKTVGAVTAAIYGLSKRGVAQMKRGNFRQTYIQGREGNIIAAGLDDNTLFVGLTSPNVNLGLAFAEVREVTAILRPLL